MKVSFVDLAAQWAPLKQDILADWEDILDSASFVGGKYLDNFEKELAAYCDTRFAIGVSSGTSALTTILRALDIGPGDKVGVQAETFIATAYAVKQVGAEVVFLDSEGVTVDDLKPLKAFIMVHIYGEVKLETSQRIMMAAEAAGCYLIEDACQAIGCPGVSNFGIATAFSFYPAKNLGCAGQGGAVITDDEALSIRVREYINQGWISDGLHAAEAGNERLDPVQATVLSRGLKELGSWNLQRKTIAQMYDAGLPPNVTPMVTPGANCVYHLYPVQCQTPALRDSLSAYLTEHDVSNARHYPKAITQQTGFRTSGFAKLENRLARHLTLPMFPTMSAEQVQYVLDVVNEWSKTVCSI